MEELVVTASLARIPIPESFSGINNPFYEDPGGTSSLGSFGLLHTEPGPRTTVKKRVLQARDLVSSVTEPLLYYGSKVPRLAKLFTVSCT